MGPIPYAQGKAWFSPLLGLIVAIPLAPVMALVWVLVKLTSPGPAFYSQVRLGRDGRPFRIYKFRTMRPDAESKTGPTWATPNDPRVTPIGGFLRSSHLDELPQIFNVLRGDMCLVGPRPERPEIAEELVRHIPNYFDRLGAKPGVTGLAQVLLPADSSIDSVRAKLAVDLDYLKKATPWLDVRIVLATALKVVPGLAAVSVWIASGMGVQH